MSNDDATTIVKQREAPLLRALTNFGLPIEHAILASQIFHQCDTISTRQELEPEVGFPHNKQRRREECHARTRAIGRRAVRHLLRQPHDLDTADGSVLRIPDGGGDRRRGDAVCRAARDYAARLRYECSNQHIGVLAYDDRTEADRGRPQPVCVLIASRGGPRQQLVQVGAQGAAVNPGFFGDFRKLPLADFAIPTFPPRHSGSGNVEFPRKGELRQIPDFAIGHERVFGHEPYVTDLVTTGQGGNPSKCDRVGQ